MENRTAYVNYKKYALQYDLDIHMFRCCYGPRSRFVEDAGLDGAYLGGKKLFDLHDFGKGSFRCEHELDAEKLLVIYGDGPHEQPELTLCFTLSSKGIQLKMDSRGDLDFRFKGYINWGRDMEHDTFAVCLGREGQELRCALGPAASTVDNALFDRASDSALELFGSAAVRLHFDWVKKAWTFTAATEGHDYSRGFGIRVRDHVYENTFDIPYKPINKNNTFPTPPAGFMTWYAVQFDACEKAVLENAVWQAEHLKDFGANTIWVDWEWYHSNFSGIGEADVDSFRPDPRRYPNGLKVVADEIKKLGLVPVLWVGFTNDPTENQCIRENLDMVLAQKPTWCGQYFLDVSHPDYLTEYLPAAFRQVLDWGYQALKWDCLPATLKYHDAYHDKMYNPELTSEQALRDAVKSAREIVGEDFYMLSCSGETSRDVLMAADLFDAARIGGDIFSWEEFISQCVERVMKFYAYHNVLFYNDPDNVILREKFNTYDQALSRLSFVSLLGLPVTLGDQLPELLEDRVELLRRGLPPIDAHPMDIRETVNDSKTVKVNLAIERPYESWNVVDILNLQCEDSEVVLDIHTDLHLPDGTYLVYDFWEREFLGEVTDTLVLNLRPCASRVLCVRRKLGRPQLLSTSRHITQGAVDVESMEWNEEKAILSAVSCVVGGDLYTVTLYVPNKLKPFSEGCEAPLSEFEDLGSGLWRFTLKPEITGKLTWSAAFTDRV